MEATEKNAIGVNLKMGNQYKRLWFSVENSEVVKNEFEKAFREIEAIGNENSEWKNFLQAVVGNFKRHGFDRIAK